MTTWVVWVVFAGVALALGFTGYHFSVRTVRVVAAVATLALVVAVTAYGLRHPDAAPSNLADAFMRGADGIASAFFTPLRTGHGVPGPGRNGWIVICVLIVLGYRELEAWALHWQAPMLDTSQLDEAQPSRKPGGTAPGGAADGLTRWLTDGQRHDPLAAELKFRLDAIQVRSPSILPGGSRSGALASIAEDSGVAGGGLAGAVIRFAGAVWPNPRRLQLQIWAEPAAAGAKGTRVTVELEATGSGATVAAKTVVARSRDEAASMVAGYIARQVFERDPTTPAWCYGASDGNDLGALQLARQERVDATDVADVERSRSAQIEILREVTGRDRCAGLVRYELAQLLDLGEDHLTALRLHAVNREQYPRFFRGRYRLAMSLEMIANPGFTFTDRETVREALDQVLGSLSRCGLTRADACPANWVIRAKDDRERWALSEDLNTVLLDAARKELRAIRRQLSLAAVTWAMFRRRDERATWKPHLRLRVRQGFRDGVEAALLLVTVRQRLNDDAISRRGYRKALRIAAAITGDSDPIVLVLRRPPREWRLTGQAPRPTRDQVRWLPWQRRTASWQAAYSTAWLYSALAQRGLAREDRIIASLRRAVGNRDSEMERPYDWIAHDPDFLPLTMSGSGRYPAFKKFLRDQKLQDYPGSRTAEHAPHGRRGRSRRSGAMISQMMRQSKLFLRPSRTVLAAATEGDRCDVFADGLAPPAGAGVPELPPGGVAVPVAADPDDGGRATRERVDAQQAEHVPVPGQQPLQQGQHPALRVSG
jgi:hypothetical protein